MQYNPWCWNHFAACTSTWEYCKLTSCYSSITVNIMFQSQHFHFRPFPQWDSAQCDASLMTRAVLIHEQACAHAWHSFFLCTTFSAMLFPPLELGSRNCDLPPLDTLPLHPSRSPQSPDWPLFSVFWVKCHSVGKCWEVPCLSFSLSALSGFTGGRAAIISADQTLSHGWDSITALQPECSYTDIERLYTHEPFWPSSYSSKASCLPDKSKAFWLYSLKDAMDCKLCLLSTLCFSLFLSGYGCSLDAVWAATASPISHSTR